MAAPASASWEGRGLNKGMMDTANNFVCEKVTSPAIDLNPDNSVSSHMSRTLLKQLPYHWI